MVLVARTGRPWSAMVGYAPADDEEWRNARDSPLGFGAPFVRRSARGWAAAILSVPGWVRRT
jgi:hypothetical protein